MEPQGKRIIKKFFDGSWMLFVPGQGRFYFETWEDAVLYGFPPAVNEDDFLEKWGDVLLAPTDSDKFMAKYREAFPDEDPMV